VALRLPLLKEWAYAGIAFDLTRAAFSHAAMGHPAFKVIVPLVILAIAAVSWALRPAGESRTPGPCHPTRFAHNSLRCLTEMRDDRPSDRDAVLPPQ
jgi:hypothetical protein